MKFRPCIDIHDGKVKQIVGGSLRDEGCIVRIGGSANNGNVVVENYVSERDASHYAALYKEYGLTGGHVILLNKRGTKEYTADMEQAELALKAYPGGLQVGGGVTLENAEEFLNMGASHLIVTSFVFFNGKLSFERLRGLVRTVGKERLVLDLSCRKKDGGYYIVTDRWQKFTELKLDSDTLDLLSEHCDEFLVHAVDVEGKASGVEEGLVSLLGEWGKIPITYAGGIGDYPDIEVIRQKGRGKLDFTVGSALDLFGGRLMFEKIAKYWM